MTATSVPAPQSRTPLVTDAIEIVDWEKVVPPPKALSEKQRDGDRALSWVRLATDFYRDPVILDMPAAERAVWPSLLALAGRSVPNGRVPMTSRQLARELDLPLKVIEHALAHLREHHRIRGGAVAATTHSDGGKVAATTETVTTVPTDTQTDDDREARWPAPSRTARSSSGLRQIGGAAASLAAGLR